MALTQLHPYGGPGGRYGSFAGKAPASGDGPHNPGTITQLWSYGGPGHRYGSFAGKEASAPVPPAPSGVAGRAHRRRIIEWDDDLYRDTVEELRALDAEIAQLGKQKRKLTKRAKRKRAPLPPGAIGTGVRLDQIIGRLEMARLELADATARAALLRQARDEEELLMVMLLS